MVDRISRLSDELLTHILSFLSTEEVVGTSVLSKRWRPLWTSVPVLDYDDEIYLRNGKPPYCFERFVYATILARDLHQPITRFRLKYGASAAELFEGDVIYDRSNADINIWVNTVIRRGIQNLDIEIYPTNLYFSLSCSSVSCRTLVVLKLNGLSLNVSSSVGLPSLKSLHVETVQFEEPNYLMGLLFGCPLLEDLKICYIDYVQDSYFLNERFNNLHFPKLVRANLLHVNMAGHDTTILLKAVCNVEFLCIHQFRADFVVPEFPHVRHLGLFFVTHNWRVVLLMLKNCPNLQSFKLNLNRSFEAKDVLPYLQFGVPDCLTSCFTKCYLKYYQGAESDLLFAKYIMQNSPSLQSMKIHSDAPNQLELLKKLALCPRKSESCELSFN